MRTSELIIRALDASKAYYAEDNLNPQVKPYADIIVAKYNELKRSQDFESAARNSKIFGVEKILQDHKNNC